jgi:hypothetical protein
MLADHDRARAFSAPTAILWPLRRGDAPHCEGMKDVPTHAYVVRVASMDEQGPGGHMTMFYAALTRTADGALACVRRLRHTTDVLSVVEEKLSTETTQLLGLRPGEARAL